MNSGWSVTPLGPVRIVDSGDVVVEPVGDESGSWVAPLDETLLPSPFSVARECEEEVVAVASWLWVVVATSGALLELTPLVLAPEPDSVLLLIGEDVVVLVVREVPLLVESEGSRVELAGSDSDTDRVPAGSRVELAGSHSDGVAVELEGSDSDAGLVLDGSRVEFARSHSDGLAGDLDDSMVAEPPPVVKLDDVVAAMPEGLI